MIITKYQHASVYQSYLDGELQTAVVHVVVVPHAALHHLHLLVPVVADGKRLPVTRALAKNIQLSLIYAGNTQKKRGR